MAGRSNTTLKKRQKEMARAEKAREKAAKRLERQKGTLNPDPETDLENAIDLGDLDNDNDDTSEDTPE